MRKITGPALLVALGVAFAAGHVSAAQVIVTKMDKNADGTTTYHFAVKTEKGEAFTAGSDFVTVYNFGGLVDGSAKSPAGWEFVSAEFGKTPTWNGYPSVMPVDIPGLSNVTWTATRTIPGGTEIGGFSATTRATGTTEGEYTAQVTRQEPMGAGSSKESKQAVIGMLPTPAFAAQ
jgi:hypothetical protein